MNKKLSYFFDEKQFGFLFFGFFLTICNMTFVLLKTSHSPGLLLVQKTNPKQKHETSN